jgi:hypothetical protein
MHILLLDLAAAAVLSASTVSPITQEQLLHDAVIPNRSSNYAITSDSWKLSTQAPAPDFRDKVCPSTICRQNRTLDIRGVVFSIKIDGRHVGPITTSFLYTEGH